MFNLIVIGAGSIGSNACNDLCFRGRHVVDINPEALQTLVNIGAISQVSVDVIRNVGNKQRLENAQFSSSYAECDIEYLKKLVNDKNVTAGLYVGAFGDYSEANEDVNNFLKLVCDSEFNSSKKFGITMDNMLPKKYDDFVQNALLSGFYVVMRTPNNAYYLVTPKWQIAIDNPFGNNLIDIFVISDIESDYPNLTKMDYDSMYDLKLIGNTKIITLIKPDQDRQQTSISLDNKGFVRVRQVHYS